MGSDLVCDGYWQLSENLNPIHCPDRLFALKAKRQQGLSAFQYSRSANLRNLKLFRGSAKRLVGLYLNISGFGLSVIVGRRVVFPISRRTGYLTGH